MKRGYWKAVKKLKQANEDSLDPFKRRGHGRHPGLLIIDSPASEEVVNEDFEQMLDSVSSAAKDIGGVQVIIGTIARKPVEAVVSSEHRLHAKGDEYLF